MSSVALTGPPQGVWSFSAPASGQQPYVFWAPSSAGKPPFDVAVGLDDVFSKDPGDKLPSAGPFRFAKGTAPFSYEITAGAKGSLWSFDNSPIRKGVREAFDGLLGSLDELGLKPGRYDLVRRYLAEAIPQTFCESLYFRYGLDPARRCVDLTPGMRLRVAFQTHQTVDPATNPLNGYVGAGSSHIDVGSAPDASGGLILGFDPFLVRLEQLTVPAPTDGAGGVIDLQTAAASLPFWRLLYPQHYPSANGLGASGPQSNPVLLGASTRKQLETGTDAYVSGGKIPQELSCFWFRGRVSVTPEVPVFVQGTPRHVPLGTTIRQFLSGFLAVPWLNGKVQWPTQSYERVFGGLAAADQSTLLWAGGQYFPVQLASGDGHVYSDTVDRFDLPILGGDALSLQVPVASA
jgi:hypothetical protein